MGKVKITIEVNAQGGLQVTTDFGLGFDPHDHESMNPAQSTAILILDWLNKEALMAHVSTVEH